MKIKRSVISFLNMNRAMVLSGSFILCTMGMRAQKLSIDGAAIRNSTQNLGGINTGLFCHFTEKFSGGIELSRFYSRTISTKPEKKERSAWDVDLNFHYNIIRFGKLDLYPIFGIGYTEQRENNKELGRSFYERYWAINSGAGIRLDAGSLKPYAEYAAVWIHDPEHILLAGISWEFGKKKMSTYCQPTDSHKKSK